VRSFSLKDVAISGLIAALYAVLSLAFHPFSFGVYQIRIAEALTILPFLTRAAIPGLFIGCMLANVFGGLGWHDIIFGSLITLAAAILTRLVYHLSRNRLSAVLAVLPAILLWIGAVVLLSVNIPVVVQAAGSLVLLLIASRCRHSERPKWAPIYALRFVSIVLIGMVIFQAPNAILKASWLIGAFALCAAWLVTWMLASTLQSGENPNLLIAPLPPVVLNAFGVSLYLSPLIGVDYWFCVQMIGIGQLIACYLLGLPLLRVLDKRRLIFE